LDDEDVAATTAVMAYSEMLRRASQPNWPSSGDYWRILVSTELRVPSASLLRGTLNTKAFREDALQSLHAMVTGADGDPNTRRPLEQLLHEVAHGPGSTPRDRQRLLHYLNRWATRSEPSQAAQVIAASLEKATQ
jgi:hypothetical protein